MRASVVVALLVAVAVATPVVAQEGTVVGRPNLELSATENRLQAGEAATLDVFISNDGDLDRGGPTQFEERVTTARNVRLRIDEERLDEPLADALEVQTGDVIAGTVPEGVSGPYPFEFELGEDVPPGTYEIPVELSYTYTNFVEYGDGSEPEYNDIDRTVVAELTVVVEERPQFELTPLPDQRVTAGDATTYRFAVENNGTQAATDAQVSLSAANSSIFFGSREAPQQATSVFVPRLDPGERRVVEVTVGTDAETAPGVYTATAAVSYRNPNGVAESSDPVELGVVVAGEQSFAVRDVTDTLRVGQTGTVRGELVNTGEVTASAAVVVVQSENPNLVPRETEYAVGDLEPGQSVPFEFTVDVPNETDPGPRSLSVVVRYRNRDNRLRTSEPVDARVSVGGEGVVDVASVESDLQVGGGGDLTGVVVNTGEENLSNAVVLLRPNSPNLAPRETEYAVGDLEPGETAPFSFRVDVSNATEPGPRLVPVAVRYRDPAGEFRTTDAVDVRVPVGAEQSFAVRNVTDSVRVGDTGTVRGTLVNTGDETVSNAVVRYRPDDPAVTPRASEYAVGNLAPGETADFEFTVDVNEEAEPGPRQFSFVVSYRDRNDDRRTSDAVDARVSVGEEQAFDVASVESDLRVGASGDVRGEVVNTGNGTISNGVVVLRSDNPNLVPRETEYAVGALDPGEAAPFSFRVDVSEEAEPGPRLVSVAVRYRNERGDLRTSDDVDARVVVGEERDEFRVEPVDATVPPGSQSVVTLRVTNVGDETLTDVDAKLFTNDPLSSDDDEAFVDELAPNETVELRFRVSVAGSALAKEYPVSVDFSYEDERGDTVLSDTYRVPVRVTAGPSRGPLVPGIPDLVVVGLAAAMVAGALWWKRGALARRFR